MSSEIASTATSPHYSWGANCDGWHLLRRDDISIIQERMPAGTAEIRHRHKHARQFFYVLAGQLSIEVSGDVRLLAAQDGIEIVPGAVHEVSNPGPGDAEFLVVSSPPSHGDREVVVSTELPNK